MKKFIFIVVVCIMFIIATLGMCCLPIMTKAELGTKFIYSNSLNKDIKPIINEFVQKYNDNQYDDICLEMLTTRLKNNYINDDCSLELQKIKSVQGKINSFDLTKADKSIIQDLEGTSFYFLIPSKSENTKDALIKIILKEENNILKIDLIQMLKKI